MAKNTIKSSSKPVASKTAEPDVQASLSQKIDAKVDAQVELILGVKAAFKASQNRDITITDKILAMVIDHAKTWDDMDDEDKIKLLLTAEEENKKIATVDPGITALIGKVDDDFHREIKECLDAKEKDKASAVSMLAQFRRVFTLAEMNGMAFPGSKPEDVVVTLGGYKADKVVRRNKTTGDEVTTVWVNDFADGLPEGKQFTADQELASKELQNSGSTKLKGVGSKQLKSIIETCKTNRNNLRSMCRRAIKLHHIFEAVKRSNSIDLEWISGAPDKSIAMPIKCGTGKLDKSNVEWVSTAPKPLWIMPQGKASDGKLLSVTQLTSTKPWLVEGGTMGDLLDTAGQGADADSGDKEGTGEKMDSGEALATLQRFYHFANVRDNNAAVRLKIANMNKDADGKEWLSLVGLVYHWAKPIYDANKAAYDTMQLKDEPALAKAV